MDLQGTLKGKWRYLIPAKPPIHNHVLIPNYQDFKIQDFCYSDGFECFQAINIGRYEHHQFSHSFSSVIVILQFLYQPLGFEDPDYPDKVYKVVKALYGLHQDPRA
nr:retrotransposon protein, putative, Ty1-copia subclass [Tanacetum cinerariifolium]